MRRGILGAASFILAALLGGCAAPYGDKAMVLAAGTPREVALSTMGPPENRQVRGDKEAWQYSNVIGPGQCEYTVIMFEAGKLYAIDNYKNESHMGCRGGTLPVKWETPAGQIIEIRQR